MQPRKRAVVALLVSIGAVTASASRSDSDIRKPVPASPAVLEATAVSLPGGEGGIGFDDMVWAPRIGRVIVPAGRSGNVTLIDPETKRIEAIGGFSTAERFGGGHSEGSTSAAEGRGFLFATDRTAKQLLVVDPRSRTIVARAPLASGPDYVRFVEPLGEVWVTQPNTERIEIFSVSATGAPALSHAAFLAVPGGPESLVIDTVRGRAYTHLWGSSTLAIDLKQRRIVETWKNGCTGSRGIALDERKGFLFAGCEEGKAVVLDLNRNGAVADSVSSGSGVDVIAYDPQTGHLYLPGAESATMAILGVSAAGKLAPLGMVNTATGAHCVAVDDRHQAWVCDPHHGQLLLVHDTLPKSGG